MNFLEFLQQPRVGTTGFRQSVSEPFYDTEEERPLRSRILTREALAEHGIEIAREDHIHVSHDGGAKLYSRFEDNAQSLEKAYFSFAESAKKGDFLTPGAEWLLDNYHVVEEHVRDIRDHFPRRYYQALPKLKDGKYVGYLRIYHLILEYVSHTDAVIDGELLSALVTSYQKHSVLTIGELWAIPIMLRFALIDNLRRLAFANISARKRRVTAEQIVDEVFNDESRVATEMLLVLAKKLKKHPKLPLTIAAYLVKRLRLRGPKAWLALQWLEEKLRESGQEPNEIERLEQHAQAANQISIGNTVTSLKTIASFNWKRWIESISKVDTILRLDPLGVYAKSDFKTRDLCRKTIEKYARALKQSEVKITRRVLSLAQEAHDEDREKDSKTQADAHNKKAHVGYYLLSKGKKELESVLGFRASIFEKLSRAIAQIAFPFYSLAVLVLSFVFVAWVVWHVINVGGSYFEQVLVGFLAFIPAFTLANDFVQWVVTHITKPFMLPKMDFAKKVPDDCKTIVTVHAIFNDRQSIRRAVEMLEVRFLGNDDPNIFFALLADLHDADKAVLSSDQDLINYAEELVQDLNVQHCADLSQRFFLLFRSRVWNASENRFMGHERKRGKVMEFNRLVMGDDDTTFSVNVGSLEQLREIKYVITLDGDTRLPRGTAKKLIAAIAHPLNHPVFDEGKRVVVEGYSVIQPRASVFLRSANVTTFAQIFSERAGIDPYTQSVSDVYQDLFHEASYLGKGIYDVAAFHKALRNRVPENALLSHDLFEGLFARVCLASDIELPDEFPSRYDVYAKRHHRWVRGDWQLLPWVFRKIPDTERNKYKTPISLLGRWKLVDNLRRSLVIPTSFFLLALSWLVLSGSALFISLFVLLVITFPLYSSLLSASLSLFRGVAVKSYVWSVSIDTIRLCKQLVLRLSFFPFQSCRMLHAITVTLYRVYISKKNLLEWETAYVSERSYDRSWKGFLIEMVLGVLLGLSVVLAVSFYRPDNLFIALPFLVLWILSPILASLISKPITAKVFKTSEKHQEYLRTLAWETWSYFDELTTAERNYLVPDNIQLSPERVVAERTSPTNIGLGIMATVAAYDLGFISVPSVVRRLALTFEALDKLERFNGHFINWYDICSLQPLAPKYISAVDSGNLAGNFIALKGALEEFSYFPLLTFRHWEHFESRLLHFHRFAQDLDINFSEKLLSLQEDLRGASGTFRGLREAIEVIDRFFEWIESEAQATLVFSGMVGTQFKKLLAELDDIRGLRSLLQWMDDFDKLCDMFESLSKNIDGDVVFGIQKKLDGIKRILEGRQVSLSLIARIHNRVLGLSTEILNDILKDVKEIEKLTTLREQLVASMGSSVDKVEKHVTLIQELISSCDKFFHEMDFKFLYNEEKDLFVIGYNIDSARADSGHYDLLASEARLASLVAIAKGDVPQKHWFALSRALADSAGGKALLSWSGTMFEYLMPLLVMRNYSGTILSETFRAIVKAQRLYAKQRRVPWGVSESGYSGVDFQKTYQYRAFGVPGLGLKRGLSDDLVISPYSTALALTIDPAACLKNMRRLETLGLRGPYGFYESVDFTPDRLSADEEYHIVESFLAHHQGMTLVSINNFLNDGIFQERFHRDPLIRATDLLLHERFPHCVPAIVPHQAELSYLEKEEEETRAPKGEIVSTPYTYVPLTQLLSNSRYSVMVDNAGSGYSVLDNDIALTRWREDSVSNAYGMYIFVRDLDTNTLWSVAYQPTCVSYETYQVIYNQDKVEFIRRDFDIGLHTEITVSPEDDVEVRRVTITNFSTKKRNLEITSFAEVSLAAKKADAAHPAFSKMFIESEYLKDHDALILSRRPRSAHDENLYLLHMLTMKVCWGRTQYETSRMNFIGRGRTLRNPIVFDSNSPLSGTVGSVLDPVMSLRTKVELESGLSESLCFVTSVSKDKEQLKETASRYSELYSITRAFEMAWSQSNVELRHEQYSARQAAIFQKLANAILFNVDKARARPDIIAKNRMGQSGFWRFGISGDLPIVVVRVTEPSQKALVEELLIAHEYLRLRGLVFDLVIVNEYPGGYFQNFQEELESLIRHGSFAHLMEKSGGIFLRGASQLSPEELILLQALARVVLFGSKGALKAQLRLEGKSREPLKSRKEVFSYIGEDYSLFHPPIQDWEYYNGLGGFTDNGKGYTININRNNLTPQPWSNVIANNKFGFLVTESGGGFTWSENSRENRLSPWSNDPISDRRGEVVYIRDADSGAYWCPTPLPINNGESYVCKHRFGFSQFETQINRIYSSLVLSGASADKVKWWHMRLVNGDYRVKSIDIYLYIEWTLGILRGESFRNLVTDFDGLSQTLHAINYYNNEFAGRYVFLGTSEKIQSYTSSREEFIGRNRDLSSPYVLERAVTPSLASLVTRFNPAAMLSGKVGAGFDSCGVLKLSFRLEPGEKKEFQLFMGEANSLDEVRDKARQYKSLEYREEELTKVSDRFHNISTDITIKTPERTFDIMMNGWLLYQTLACRIYGRSAFFQSGGAFGFRDQLQDVLALIYSEAKLARNQILLHASRQFVDGDVQHWWHPPTGRGVRTRISDDYLWLPYVVSEYLAITDDQSILDEEVNFLEGEQLESHQAETYIVPHPSSHVGTIYEHCIIALDRALRFGEHGLPLMGGGDWNDGMNEVGIGGKGESVWLGFFIYDILSSFIAIVKERKDNYRARKFKEKASALQAAIEKHAWDGQWYLRAFFDDGTPLGSSKNEDCQIDSLSQSWGVISGAAKAKRANTAMESVYEKLVNEQYGIISLLKPPFYQGAEEPGYIKGYLPGIRENGGQYTHAAAWVIKATALLGKGTKAFSLFNMINPINHCLDEKGLKQYQGEPYVTCGDVYGYEPYTGRAGWSWYTGSAAWLYKVGLENILGLKLRGRMLRLDPCIPADWEGFELNYRVSNNIRFQFFVKNPNKVEKGIKHITIDGQETTEEYITIPEVPEAENRDIKVEVEMG